MGKIDLEARNYLSDNARFADIFNYLIYDGAPTINPDALTEMDSAEIIVPYGNEAREPEQRFRDLLKLWQTKTDGKRIYAIALGGELQAHVHYAMPVRSGLYDFMYYAKQVSEAGKSYRKQRDNEKRVRLGKHEFLSGFRKKDRLIPVITLTVLFSPDKWDGPLSIKEMLNTEDPQVLQYVQDYRIHLLTPDMIPKDDLKKFSTDFREVMEYIKYSNDNEMIDNIVHSDDRFRKLDVEAANLINAATKSDLKFNDKEKKVDMCKAIDDMKKEAWTKGHTEGREQGREQERAESDKRILTSIKAVMKKLSYSAQQAMDFLEVPAADQEKYMMML